VLITSPFRGWQRKEAFGKAPETQNLEKAKAALPCQSL